MPRHEQSYSVTELCLWACWLSLGATWVTLPARAHSFQLGPTPTATTPSPALSLFGWFFSITNEYRAGCTGKITGKTSCKDAGRGSSDLSPQLLEYNPQEVRYSQRKHHPPCSRPGQAGIPAPSCPAAPGSQHTRHRPANESKERGFLST